MQPSVIYHPDYFKTGALLFVIDWRFPGMTMQACIICLFWEISREHITSKHMQSFCRDLGLDDVQLECFLPNLLHALKESFCPGLMMPSYHHTPMHTTLDPRFFNPWAISQIQEIYLVSKNQNGSLLKV